MTDAVSNLTSLAFPGEGGILSFAMDTPLQKAAAELVSLRLQLAWKEREVEEMRRAVEEKFQELKQAVIDTRIEMPVAEDACRIIIHHQPTSTP